MIVISSVPYTETGAPLLAPALLKSCVTKAGYNCVTVDLNFEILQRLEQSPNKWKILNFFRTQYVEEGTEDEIAELLEYSANRLLENNPTIVALSLLTQDCQFFTVWLCYHLKCINPNINIVIGGSGVKSFIAQADINFGKELRKDKMINAYINGDGENSIVEYVKGNLNYPGINSNTWEPIVNLNELPFADFSDYRLNEYPQQAITLCDSRGCVRTCEFCDIIEHWKKYQYRTAENIFEELIYQIEHHNIRHFMFNNSLTNGNMREFKKLLDLISNYNSNNDPISWEGYFIVRNKKQHPEEMWEKMSKSNGKLLLGVESVIEPVRINLGKNFANVDIDYHLEMARKYQVPVLLLLIVGYPTETKQDFEFTKQWFKDRVEYANNTVFAVQLSIASILPGTELKRKQDDHKLTIGEVPTIWLTEVTDVTPMDRIDYYVELSRLLNNLGYNANQEDEYGIQVMRDEIEILERKQRA